jgi:hypothetical protein
MSGRTVAGAALSVLAATPAEGYTTNEIVAILRERQGFAPDKAYADVVYSGLMSQLRAGKVTRSRETGGVWSWRVSGSTDE